MADGLTMFLDFVKTQLTVGVANINREINDLEQNQDIRLC